MAGTGAGITFYRCRHVRRRSSDQQPRGATGPENGVLSPARTAHITVRATAPLARRSQLHSAGWWSQGHQQRGSALVKVIVGLLPRPLTSLLLLLRRRRRHSLRGGPLDARPARLCWLGAGVRSSTAGLLRWWHLRPQQQTYDTQPLRQRVAPYGIPLGDTECAGRTCSRC